MNNGRLDEKSLLVRGSEDINSGADDGHLFLDEAQVRNFEDHLKSWLSLNRDFVPFDHFGLGKVNEFGFRDRFESEFNAR